MNRKLILQVTLGLTAVALLALASCTKNPKTDVAVGGGDSAVGPVVTLWQFNKGDMQVPAIQFAQPSPNGGMAWLGFQYINPQIQNPLSDSAYVTAGGAGGFRLLMGWPKANNDTAYDTSLVYPNVGPFGLPPNGKAMLIPQYKIAPGPKSPWVPYDSVTLIANGNPVSSSTILTMVNSTGGTYQATFKSKDGSQGASVVVVITGTGN